MPGSKNIPTMVVGILPSQFEAADASAIISLAATVVATLVASDHDDPQIIRQVLEAAAATFERMRPAAQNNLLAVAEEMITSIKAGKNLMVLGGFRSSSEKA